MYSRINYYSFANEISLSQYLCQNGFSMKTRQNVTKIGHFGVKLWQFLQFVGKINIELHELLSRLDVVDIG